MQIRIAHRFPVSPRAYWDGTRDPDLDARIAEAGDLDVTVLERRREGGHSHQRIRCSPRKELPVAAQKALGAARFSYVQVVDADDATMTTRWEVHSDLASDRVTCHGTSRVVPMPDGCERIIEGEIKIALPLVGGTVERLVVEQLERSYDRAADFLRQHLAGAR